MSRYTDISECADEIDGEVTYRAVRTAKPATLYALPLWAANIAIDGLHSNARTSYLSLAEGERADARRSLRLAARRLQALADAFDAIEQTYTT